MGTTSRMKFESLDGTYKNGNVVSIFYAIQLATWCKLQGFKLYDENGCFLYEYALFDGKYREVAPNGL